MRFIKSYISLLLLLKTSTTTTNSTATDSNHNRKRARTQVDNKLNVMNETEPPAKKVRPNLPENNAKKSTQKLSSCIYGIHDICCKIYASICLIHL